MTEISRTDSLLAAALVLQAWQLHREIMPGSVTEIASLDIGVGPTTAIKVEAHLPIVVVGIGVSWYMKSWVPAAMATVFIVATEAAYRKATKLGG